MQSYESLLLQINRIKDKKHTYTESKGKVLTTNNRAEHT